MLQFNLGVNERLRLLEELNNLTDLQHFTPAMPAAIAPMCNAEIEMVRVAMALDGGDDGRADASFKVLTSPRIFRIFQELNPSLRAAQDRKAAPVAEGG